MPPPSTCTIPPPSASAASAASAASEALKTLNIKHPIEYATKMKLFKPLTTPQVLLRGACLRIASDLTGGLPLENLKTTLNLNTTSVPFKSTLPTLRTLTSSPSFLPHLPPLYCGYKSRLIESSLIGSLFLLTSSTTRRATRNFNPITSSFISGISGGLGQCIIMIPSTNIMTTIVDEKINFGQAVKRIYDENGLGGFWRSSGTLAVRQASNWSSRTTFTALLRPTFGRFGMGGEVAAGLVAGVLSCWNTPVETLRIEMQSCKKGYKESWEKAKEKGLWRGVDVRMAQAGWQTVWMVVVPSLMRG
ncbi:hypothetical protein TrVE_jg7311 [Triparma verrucosa]|uniref:Mitochondrial carrier protein n=1 Tax=Triparma verrucosa TaxID=1606542 RepID=A0A9W7FLF4_9STRA|nr:hypothetical protein TrVE_jg7311 [Triparma verrucosa]